MTIQKFKTKELSVDETLGADQPQPSVITTNLILEAPSTASPGETITLKGYLKILFYDINGPDGKPDGKVDIRDLTTVAWAFGSFPGYPTWNPIADLNGDDKVNIRDIALMASVFGVDARNKTIVQN